MELRHLRYFIAIVEEQSFTKAADKLCIAQPPLSRQIQNLEEELGVQLIERGSRPVRTTPVGEFFYQYAVKLLSNTDQMIAMTKRVASVETVFKIGFVGSLLFGYLPRIVHLFKQSHPNLKIELYELSTHAQIEALKNGKIDVGFGRLRISDPAIKRTLLRNERLMMAVHSSHELVQKQANGAYLTDIVDEKILLFPSTVKPNYSTHILSIFSDHGLDPKNLTEVREVQLALGLVAAGEGVCIVPASISSIQLYNLSYIPLLEPDAVSPVFIATRNMEESTYIYSIMETIRQIYTYEGFPTDHFN